MYIRLPIRRLRSSLGPVFAGLVLMLMASPAEGGVLLSGFADSADLAVASVSTSSWSSGLPGDRDGMPERQVEDSGAGSARAPASSVSVDLWPIPSLFEAAIVPDPLVARLIATSHLVPARPFPDGLFRPPECCC